MGQLTHNASDFDAAIRKVRADYADVSDVNAGAADVVIGQKIIGANRAIITGTLGTLQASPSVEISGGEVSETASPYPIQANGQLHCMQDGVIDSIPDGSVVTKYIRVEEKSGTPSYEGNVEITPSANMLLSRVTVAATPAFESKIRDIPMYNWTMNPLKVGTGYAGQIAAGTTESNVYARDIERGRIYMIPVGTSVTVQNTFQIADPTTGKLDSRVVVLKPGDSFSSQASTYSPGGSLNYLADGKVQFYHASSFKVGSGFSNCPILLLKDGVYYAPCVDWKLFGHGYTGYGSRVSGGGICSNPNNAQIHPASVAGYRNFVKARCLMGNLTNIYWYSDVDTTSSSELPRMTFNYGSYYPLMAEADS